MADRSGKCGSKQLPLKRLAIKILSLFPVTDSIALLGICWMIGRKNGLELFLASNFLLNPAICYPHIVVKPAMKTKTNIKTWTTPQYPTVIIFCWTEPCNRAFEIWSLSYNCVVQIFIRNLPVTFVIKLWSLPHSLHTHSRNREKHQI